MSGRGCRSGLIFGFMAASCQHHSTGSGASKPGADGTASPSLHQFLLLYFVCVSSMDTRYPWTATAAETASREG